MKAFGSAGADFLLLQPVFHQELSDMDAEAAALRQRVSASFLLIPVPVNNWNDDLSPWPAPPVFGSDDFGGGAKETLQAIIHETIPQIKAAYAVPDNARVLLGGYSLAGLFALWCGHETDMFHGIAAASPSVWFPGFLDWAKRQPFHARAVSLSLGDKEERTRNPVMRQVGDCIRALHAHYQSLPGVAADLQWNAGNHFRDAGERTAKAFAWAVNALNR